MLTAPRSALIVLTLAGCCSIKPRWFEDAKRADSFRPYAEFKIEGIPIKTLLNQRSGVLIYGVPTVNVAAHSSSITVGLLPQKNATVSVGHAVAITSDGYFLTAAHCLSPSANTLIYREGESLKAAVPRLVAGQSDLKKHLDFAIIHVNATNVASFEWASLDDAKPTSAVIGLGSSSPYWKGQHFFTMQTCFAGHVLRHEGLANHATAIHSDLPGRQGDSGGPLVAANGTLLGIHHGSQTKRGGDQVALALRPDLSWLNTVIEKDRAASGSRPDGRLVTTNHAAATNLPTITVRFD